MKKLLMATALVSSLAAAGALATEGQDNFMVQVRGAKGPIETRLLVDFANRLHGLDYVDVHRITIDLEHRDGRIEFSPNREVTAAEQAAIEREIEEILRSVAAHSSDTTEVRTRHLSAPDTDYYVVKKGRMEKKK